VKDLKRNIRKGYHVARFTEISLVDILDMGERKRIKCWA
jgi:hypothetical protein